MLITIDGTAGSGKGTLSKLFAEKLNAAYLDTGFMYRALGFFVKGSPLISHENFCVIAFHGLTFTFENEIRLLQLHGDSLQDLGIEESQLTTKIVEQAASKVGVHARVREKMVELQRKLVAERQAEYTIVDGRDGGTHIFPEAECKIFLYCNAEIAGERRALQVNDPLAAASFAKSIAQRNQREITRDVALLKPATGALVINTTHCSVEQVFSQVWNRFEEVNYNLGAWANFVKNTNC